MDRSDHISASRLLGKALLAMHLLGFAFGLIHPLEVSLLLPCFECAVQSSGWDRYLFCDRPGCPDPEHHHHPGHEGAGHDPTICTLCQAQVPACAASNLAVGLPAIQKSGEILQLPVTRHSQSIHSPFRSRAPPPPA